MNDIIISTTRDLGLEDVIAKLSRNKSVEGILLIGSFSKDQLLPESDYDLVIILTEAVKPWYVGVTYIDHRFTDLIFVANSEVKRIADLERPVAHGHALAPIIRWFRDGSILFARSLDVEPAGRKAKSAAWIEPVGDEAVYGTWSQINYNLAQLRRMMVSNDPMYRQAVEIRMAVYGHSDIWFGYFTIRKLEWQGDKAAIRYLSDHDPEFLMAYQQFIKTTDVRAKFSIYERLVSMTTAPAGGVWPPDATVMNLEHTLQIWQALLDGEL